MTTEAFRELDIGCGDRIDLPVRVDVKRTRAANILADAHYLPFRNEAFNNVRILEVLEHLSSPFTSLLECQRVLKSRGMLTVQVPNLYYIGKLGRLLIKKGEKLLPRERDHKQTWDQITLRNLLDQVGFSQTKFEYTDYYGARRKVLHLLPRIFGRTHLRVLAEKRVL